jgi:hypothetical protein
MACIPAPGRHSDCRIRVAFLILAFAVFFLSFPVVRAAGSPHIVSVSPASGKVGDTITVSGENLGKPGVSAVFLSDDKSDYKASMIDQGADKIVMKVPQVKPGDYNVSIQAGTSIYIQPVLFTVQQ